MKQWKLILVTLLAVLMVCICTSAMADVCEEGCTQGTVYTTRPTCTEEGVLALVKCTVKGCDNYMVEVESWPVAAFGHDMKKSNIVKPTCTKEGYDVYTCEDCGEKEKRNIVPATGHDFAGGTFQDIKQAATCVATGVAMYKCADCDVIGEVTIPVNTGAHEQVEVPAKAPSCIAAGNEKYYKCELCGVKLGGGLENLPLDPNAHKWTSVPAKLNTCTEAGYNAYDKCTLCGKIATADGQIPVTQPYGHKYEVVDWKVKPDCVTVGILYKRCAHCKDLIEVEMAVDPEGHKWTSVPAKLNTCTEAGYNSYDKCTLCGKIATADGQIPVTQPYGHKWSYVRTLTAATCIAEGLGLEQCDHCKEQQEKVLPIAPDAHKWTSVPAKLNTCTEAGYNSYDKCTLCGKIATADGQIPVTQPFGHNWVDSKVLKEATCTAPGVMKQRCTHCNATQEVEIKQLPHTEVLDTNLSYPSTCETDGLNFWVCTTCDEYTREEVLPKSDHLMRIHAIIAPTCEEAGYELWLCQYCCGYEEERRTVDALGHNWETVRVAEPTCTKEGYTQQYCDQCKTYRNIDKTPVIAHKFTVKDATKAPTCENEGFTWYYCEYGCGNREKQDFTAATGHAYFLVENIEPTCQAEGIQTYKCPNAGCETPYKTVKVEKLAHAYADSKWTAVVAPTCTETGREKNICIMCEDKAPIYRDVPALGHKMGEPTAYAGKAPTCTKDGEGWIKCVRCSLEENVVIPATGHDMKETKLVDATCTKQGLIKLTCRNKCGLTEYEFIPATGHQNVSVVAETAPTCTENGSVTKQCADCDTVFTDPVPATGHSYVQVEAAKPTCTEGDYAVLKCSVCGDTKDGDYAEATGHNFQPWTEAAPTCTEGDYAVEKCVACGETREGAYAEATGHNYEEVEAAAPTCTEGDYAVLKCSVCGDTKDGDYAEATGHNYVEVEVAAPTCTEGDYAVLECSVCGETQNGDYAEATGHNYVEVEAAKPTCTEGDYAVLECTVCGETKDGDYAAATGHEYEWVMNVVVPTPAAPGENHYKCKKCGDVAEVEYVKYTKYYYHNTVTSFGPTTEEVVGGDDWYRVTPIDLSVDGIFTFDLIASNDYVVGTVTITISEGVMTVSYDISARYFEIEEEALVLYASKADLAEGNAVTVAFGEDINLAELFGEDTKIIVSLKLIATYDAAAAGVYGFEADAEEIADMLAIID